MEKEDLRVKRTKKLLTNAFMELLEKMPYEKISINDLCEKAMVHRATFYNHFSDKNDLFNYALDEIEDEMFLNAIEGGEFSSSKEMYSYMIARVLDYIEINRERFRLIINNNTDKLLSLISTTMKRSVRYLISKNTYEEECIVPIDIIIDFFMGGLTEIVIDWLRSDTYKKEELLKFFEFMINEEVFKKNPQ